MSIYPTDGYSLDAIKEMVLQIFPRGPIWRSAGTSALAEALARGLQRGSNRVADLLREQFGSTASETILAWAREYGLLSDACSPFPSSEADRQAAIQAAERAQGGQDPAYYVGVAAGLQVVIDIAEVPVSPTRCGVARCGDELAGEDAAYEWLVIGPASTAAALQDRLECLISRLAPSHTVVHYSWSA